MKKVLIIIAIIFMIAVNIQENPGTNSDNQFRLRVIPNSNNIEDYEVKLLVVEILERSLSGLFNGNETLEETNIIIENNLDEIDSLIASTLTPLNQDYTISHGLNYFPVKELEGVIYPAGEYESLVITIEEGKGDNWWCILFSPVCSLEKKEEEEETEYEMFLSRIINRLIKYT